MANPQNSGRNGEARDTSPPGHRLAVSPEKGARSRTAPATDDVPTEPSRRHLRHGLSRCPNGSLWAALRLVRDRSRKTRDPTCQRDRSPDGRLGGPTATRSLSRRPTDSIPGPRQRLDLLGSHRPIDCGFRHRGACPHGNPRRIQETDRRDDLALDQSAETPCRRKRCSRCSRS